MKTAHGRDALHVICKNPIPSLWVTYRICLLSTVYIHLLPEAHRIGSYKDVGPGPLSPIPLISTASPASHCEMLNFDSYAPVTTNFVPVLIPMHPNTFDLTVPAAWNTDPP